MHDLMCQGLSDYEIMKLLNLPQKKYYRYRQELFEQEKFVAQELVSDDELLFQLSILRDRLRDAYFMTRSIVNGDYINYTDKW